MAFTAQNRSRYHLLGYTGIKISNPKSSFLYMSGFLYAGKKGKKSVNISRIAFFISWFVGWVIAEHCLGFLNTHYPFTQYLRCPLNCLNSSFCSCFKSIPTETTWEKKTAKKYNKSNRYQTICIEFHKLNYNMRHKAIACVCQ